MSSLSINNFEAVNSLHAVSYEGNKPVKLNEINKIALKSLAMLGMVAGSVVAMIGTVVLVKITLTAGIFEPLLAIGFTAGYALLHLSMMLCSNPTTALGAALTLPAAGFFFALPFVIPVCVGGLPGLGIAGLSFWAWTNLSEKVSSPHN